MFIGHPRSGSSITGAVLDAHQDVVIGNELMSIRPIAMGYDRNRLFQYLLDRSVPGVDRWDDGKRYGYKVPGSWQGRFDSLRVIGDKQAWGTTLYIRSVPRALDRLLRLAPRLRCVQVIRNPFDNIATMARRAEEEVGVLDLEAFAEQYFQLCDTVRWIEDQVGSSAILRVRHEDFVADPRTELAALCAGLGIQAAPDYLDACSSIVRASPHQSRSKVEWADSLIRSVEDRISRYAFLQGYAFDA